MCLAASDVHRFLLAGVKMPTDHKEQMMFNRSMSEEDFFKWLSSRGVSDKDCKTLSGKMHHAYHDNIAIN